MMKDIKRELALMKYGILLAIVGGVAQLGVFVFGVFGVAGGSDPGVIAGAVGWGCGCAAAILLSRTLCDFKVEEAR